MLIETKANGNSCSWSCDSTKIVFIVSTNCGLDKNQAMWMTFNTPPDRLRSVRGSVCWKPITSQCPPMVGQALFRVNFVYKVRSIRKCIALKGSKLIILKQMVASLSCLSFLWRPGTSALDLDAPKQLPNPPAGTFSCMRDWSKLWSTTCAAIHRCTSDQETGTSVPSAVALVSTAFPKEASARVRSSTVLASTSPHSSSNDFGAGSAPDGAPLVVVASASIASSNAVVSLCGEELLSAEAVLGVASYSLRRLANVCLPCNRALAVPIVWTSKPQVEHDYKFFS
mmetsp:Transcript_52127/g.124161  ORF Transcript_52127/g.124161 Transcript_52127/m.124161 type:complete len:284 (-) Transcript_52127:29-880(-)